MQGCRIPPWLRLLSTLGSFTWFRRAVLLPQRPFCKDFSVSLGRQPEL